MKRHFILLLTTCVAMVAMSEMRVSKEEVQKAALNYYQKISDDPKGEYTIGTPEPFSLLGLAEMWLIQVNDCWILVSSDKRTEAILARFTTLNKPDLKSYPPAAQYLISCYEHDIAFVRDSCKDCPIRSSWETITKQQNSAQTKKSGGWGYSVTPLLGDIAWHQYGNGSDDPYCNYVYNKYCPEIVTNSTSLCDHAVVGCVAVAVGQIMRYWKWPYAAPVPTTVGGSTKELKFYNWDLMATQLYNWTDIIEVNMVAGFLRDLGYDLDMDYGESSYASIDDAYDTFVHFGYEESTLTKGMKWNTSGWTNILHSEIAAGRPVYYKGRTAAIGGDGHAFILDGFDAGYLYHVNFGWGGYCDEYYFIDTITADGSNFSHWQAAIWGIQPAQSNCSSLIVSSVSAPKFCIAQEGLVTLAGADIHNVTDGRIYSETGIRLTAGTHIANGCNVQLAIKPIPCEPPIIPTYIAAKHFDSEESLLNNVQAYDKIPIPEELYIFSIDGKLVLRDACIDDIKASLSNGVYIIKGTSQTGEAYQSKIIVQH